MIMVELAKKIMRVREKFPALNEEKACELNEIFNHETFLDGNDSIKKAIMLKSSESKYASEKHYPFDNYFGFSLKPLLHDQTVLDLGCFTGGRSVAWFESYALRKLSGIDVRDIFIDAAQQFSSLRGANTEFKKGTGEAIPFDDDTFDAILSFDVLEHVRDVRQTLKECHRVLKKGGRLYLVFPSYFHPTEHHLGLVTNIPFLNLMFTGNTLVKAYCKILEERGDSAYWYRRSKASLEPWEKSNTINGTTFLRFKQLIKNTNWRIVSEIYKPIGSIGRNSSSQPLAKLVSKIIYPFIYVPVLQEVFLHRITFILEK